MQVPSAQIYNVHDLEVLPAQMATPAEPRGTSELLLPDGIVLTDAYYLATNFAHHATDHELQRVLAGSDVEQAQFENLRASLEAAENQTEASSSQTLEEVERLGADFATSRAYRLANYINEAGGIWVRPIDPEYGVARLIGLAIVPRPEFPLTRAVVEGKDGETYLLQAPDLTYASVYIDKKLLAK